MKCSHHHSAGNACSWEDLSFNSSTPRSGQLLSRCNMAILLGWSFTCSGVDGKWLVAWFTPHLQVISWRQDPKTVKDFLGFPSHLGYCWAVHCHSRCWQALTGWGNWQWSGLVLYLWVSQLEGLFRKWEVWCICRDWIRLHTFRSTKPVSLLYHVLQVFVDSLSPHCP